MATSARQSVIGERPARVAWPALAMAAIVLVALGLRLGLALLHPTLDWPDEIFQTTEPAHRLAFGHGVVTWEWRDGTRNWVLPGMLALIMRLTSWIGGGSAGYMRAITLATALLSLTVVWAGYWWGTRAFGGSRAGLVVAMVCAVWYDVVYYGPRTLNEVVAAHLLVAGLYLAYWANPQERDRGRLLAAGALLGAVVGLRIQLAPAVAVALLYLWFRMPRRQWTSILLGAAAAFLAFGLVDAFTWSYPFASCLRSVRVNLLQGRSAQFGVAPWSWYGIELILHIGWLLPFSLVGVRRSPFLAAVAATVLATHSALGHKEYRFVYPAVVLLVMLGGLGMVEVAKRLERQSQPSARVVGVFAVVMLGVAIATWRDAPARSAYNGTLPAFQSLSRDPSVCGVGLRGYWFWSGGYTYLHRNVPIIPLSAGKDSTLGSAFNALVTTDSSAAHPAAFVLDRCWGNSCLYRRAGGCTSDPGHEINAYLRHTGQ